MPSARNLPKPIAASLCVLGTLVLAAGVFGQTVDSNLFVADGAVGDIAISAGKVYVAGGFHSIGPATGHAVPLDASSGALLASFPKVAGDVLKVVADGTGGWYVAGWFTIVGGLPRSHLAHLAPDLSVLPWAPNPNGVIVGVVVAGGVVYVSGWFSTIGGQSRRSIAAFDASTGALLPLDPHPNSGVECLAVSGSTLYLGGYFDSVGGQTRNRLAAVDATTGVVTPWNPNANDMVSGILPFGSNVFVCGNFTSIGGQPRNGIACVDVNAGTATTWNANSNSYVTHLAQAGATLYASGGFTNIGGQTRSGIAALDLSTGAATSWNPGLDGLCGPMVVSGGTIYVAGSFDNVGVLPRNGFAAINLGTGVPNAWNPPRANNTVSSLAVSGATVYAGGAFGSFGAQPRDGLAAFDDATGALTPWNPGSNGGVYKLSVVGSNVYACGGFTSIGGQARNGLAALDGTTGAATSWNPNPNGTLTFSLLASGSGLVVGGDFTNIGGQARNHLAALDYITGAATSWNPNPNGSYADPMTTSGTTLYVAGNFTSIGGQLRDGLAAVDANTGLASSWNPSHTGDIHDMVANGPTVYVAGTFTSVGGQPRANIAALDATTGLATNWNPAADSDVYDIELIGTRLFAGGSFQHIGGQPHNYIAALDICSQVPIALGLEADNEVHSLAAYGSTLYVGGYFHVIGGLPQDYLARITNAAPTCYLTPAYSTTSGSSPTALTTADFDEDGVLDLAVVNSAAPNLSILRGHVTGGLGDGTFQPGVLYALPNHPRDVATADFNADGILDLVVPTLSGVSVLRGNGGGGVGNGTFAAPMTIAGSTSSTDVDLGDFDEDGIVDLAIANGTRVQFYRGSGTNGNGNGTFVLSGSTTFSNTVTCVAVSDFNADGVQDVAVTRSPGNGLAILLGNGSNGRGNGTFATPVDYPTLGGGAGDIAIGDFNEDGIRDLALTVVTTGQVHVLLGQGTGGIANGAFQLADTYAVGGSPRGIGVMDANGDGHADIVVACQGPGTLQVLLGQCGGGRFASSQTPFVGGGSYGLVIQDFQQDEAPEVIITNFTADTITRIAGGCASSLLSEINVVSPNGGEVLLVQKNATISWTKGPGMLGTTVELWRGAGWQTLAKNVVGNSFTWTVTPPITSSARLRVSETVNESHTDLCDATFSIANGLAIVSGAATGNPAPRLLADGDFDKDGILDLVVCHDINACSVLKGGGSGGNGDGTFSLATTIPLHGVPKEAVVADFNADGNLDIVASVDSATSGNLSLCLGSGTMTFGSPAIRRVAERPEGVAVVDVNQDGILDLAVCMADSAGNAARGGLRLLLGQGSLGNWNGTFALGTKQGPGGAVRIVAQDFNGDGVVDLAYTATVGSNLVILHMAAGGGISSLETDALGSPPFGLACGDFDADAAIDLAVGAGRSLRILRGTPQAPQWFAAWGNYATPKTPRALVTGDLDGDGVLDIASSCDSLSNVQLWLGNGTPGVGDGTFALQGSMAVTSAYGLARGDFVHGGLPELAVTASTVDSLAVRGGSWAPVLATTLALTTPNGGEAWALQSLQHITWTKGAGITGVDVEVSHDDGLSWQRVASNVPGTSLAWLVTPAATASARARVLDSAAPWRLDQSDVAWSIDDPTDVSGTTVRVAGLTAPYPNPTRSTVRFAMSLTSPSQVEVEVFDVAGRRVRQLVQGAVASGIHELSWDGRDERGRRCAQGIYFVKASWSRYDTMRKVVLLR